MFLKLFLCAREYILIIWIKYSPIEAQNVFLMREINYFSKNNFILSLYSQEISDR